jgi:excisionase family DNA binding protein
VRSLPALALVPRSLLTVKDVALQLGVSTTTVYKLCYSGALPHIRIIGSMRIAPADLAAFIEAKHQGGNRS